MKYSIIVVAHNALIHSVQCIESIFKFSKDFELIVVDNGSTDGSAEYFQSIIEHNPNMHIIYNKENSTYARANNQGLVIAKGEYIVFLNNDTIVNEEWLERIRAHFDNVPMKHIGMVGPVSNNSNGRQSVGLQNPEAWHAENRGRWTHAGKLFGWCMMTKKIIMDEIGGFDEQFENSFDDNDLCLRMQLAGYKLIIAYDTYIHHAGQSTFKAVMTTTDQYMDNGYINQCRFYDKWRNTEKKKLVAVYRTNGGKWLEKSLEKTSKFADSIIIHFCRARASITDERLTALLANFPKIVHTEWYDGIFQEDYERGRLLELALDLHKKGGADWCISIDDDELYEDKFIERCQKMMSPRNPEVMGYWCQWRTIWYEENGQEYYRTDSTFGQFSNYRFFKLLKNQEITSVHPEGHHCGSNPVFAPENLRWANIRVKHMGYNTPAQRQKKYEFYEANDHFKDPNDIGHEDYSHLIDLNVTLERYNKDNGISLVMMIKNEEENIQECLESMETLVDEMVIVDTGSTDRTIEIINEFAKYSPINVKLLNHPWVDNYSIPRNFGKEHCTKPWILMMDADERFDYGDLPKLFTVSERDGTQAIIFHCINYMEKKTDPNKLPKYASTETMRMYRNIPEFYYTGIIHETVDDSLYAIRMKKPGTVVATSPIVLHHYGYLKVKDKLKEKLEYYEKLNNEQIRITDGKDPRPYFNLALHYLNDDATQIKALEHFRKALEIKPGFWHANQQMAALNIKSAKTFLEMTLATIPENHSYRKEAIEILEYLNQKSMGYQKIEV